MRPSESTALHSIRFRRIAAAPLALALLLPATALAQEYTAPRKMGRGLAAITCAFLEVPGNIVDESRRNGPGRGWTLGLAMGVGKIVPRVLIGVYEFLSAPIEAPSGFKPILEPEYPWDYFD